VIAPSGRRFVVRAVATDDELEQQQLRYPIAFLLDGVFFLIRAAYRAVRRRPQRAPGFVVAVIDERRLLGGIVHTEPVALESGIAEKMNELSAQLEAGDFLEHR
jgi:hypothetical protein